MVQKTVWIDRQPNQLNHPQKILRLDTPTDLAVQQKLMRHSGIRTTLNVYGDVVTDEMRVAESKIAGMVLRH
jgi:integrase